MAMDLMPGEWTSVTTILVIIGTIAFAWYVYNDIKQRQGGYSQW